MTKRKNPVVWAARKKRGSYIFLFRGQPIWDVNWKEWDGKNYVGEYCHKLFSRITGLKLKPGECKAIRINVEVVK